MNGLVIKSIGGFYTVKLFDSGKECVCRLRGRLRLDRDTVLVGDHVEVSEDSSADKVSYVVERVNARKNRFIRPPVANVDRLAIVFTASEPKPDLMLVDKLTLFCEQQGITPILVLNKDDISEPSLRDSIINDYKCTGYPLILTSTYTGDGLDALRAELKGNVTCFTGQSGTGKSSLLNALIPELSLQVGAVSERSKRGKHTTRETRLCSLDGDGMVVDSPGFSLLDSVTLPPEELCRLYPEMRSEVDKCRFVGCLHVTEPDCAVKVLVECPEDARKLSLGRYERYKRILEELKEKDKHKYDH